jgi:transposase
MVAQHIGGRCAGTILGVLRDRVAATLAAGASARAAARRFGISVSTAIGWAQRLRTEGHARARAMGGDHRSHLGHHRATVLPGATMTV